MKLKEDLNARQRRFTEPETERRKNQRNLKKVLDKRKAV